MTTQQYPKPTLTSKLITPPSPQMQKKVRQMIRKKALLYGVQQLTNPSLYNRNSIIQISIKNNQTKQSQVNIRSRSSLVSSSLNLSSSRKASNNPTTKNTVLQQKQTKNKLEIQQTQSIAQKIPSYKLDFKTHKQKVFPALRSLKDLVEQQKQIIHVFKDKLDYDLNDVVFQFLKILELAIKYQSELFSEKIIKEMGILIQTLEFLTESFLECKFDKVALVLAIISVNICEFYKQIHKIGKFLFTIAKVLRRIFKYEQSVLTLKKALQYTWYARKHIQKQKQNQKDKPQNNKPYQSNKQYTNNNSAHNQHKRNPSNQINQLNANKNQPHQQTSYQQYQQTVTTELQIYNQLSYCLLQINKPKQSKIFAQKYQIGYLEKQSSNSNLLNLSEDLIGSAQKRIVEWQRVNKTKFDLTFGIEFDVYLNKYQQSIKNKFNEAKFLQKMKVNMELLLENFFKKEIFFYEIPLSTEIKNQELQEYRRSHIKKLPIIGQKFVYKKKFDALSYKKRSVSVMGNHKKNQNNNVGESKILNYRGIGLSRSKLAGLFKKYIDFIKITLDNHKGNKLSPMIKLPILLGEKMQNSSNKARYQQTDQKQLIKKRQKSKIRQSTQIK